MMVPRTVDRLFSGEVLRKPNGLFGWEEWPQPIFTTEADLRDMSSPIIAIDNVQKHLLSPKPKIDEWALTELPSVAPPFPSFWLDSHIDIQPGSTDQVWYRDKKRTPFQPYNYALYVHAIKLDHENPDRDDPSVKGRDAMNRVWAERTDRPDREMMDPEDAWYLEVLPFIMLPKVKGKREVMGPVGVACFSLNADGICRNDGYFFTEDSIPGPATYMEAITPETIRGTFARIVHTMVYPGMFAVGLLHCKNVETVERIPTEKEQKVFRKKGTELRSYHTLVVDQRTRKRYVTPEGVDVPDPSPTGRHMGFHIVRGHFKTYTADAPLLGKHVGTWWWDQNTRGDEDYGLIAKDYDVRP